jgi:hypothetical protein
MDYYRPLPDNLTVKKTKNKNLGLFATNNIPANIELGITHIKNWNFEDGYIRTPLGGFFNYDDNPNCTIFADNKFVKLRTIAEIKEGDELTVKCLLCDI